MNLVMIPLWNVLLSGIKDKKKRIKIVSWIIFVQLSLFISLRSPDTTYDTKVYLGIFDTLKASKISFLNWRMLLDTTNLEIGFSYMMLILAKLGISHQVFITLFGVATLFLIKLVIDKWSSIPWLSYYLLVSLGFYTRFFSMIRQALAISLVFIGVSYLMEEKKRIFIFYIILSSLVHQTAIICLLLLLFWDRNFKLYYILYIFIGSFLIWVFSNDIVAWLLKNTKYSEMRRVVGSGHSMFVLYIFLFFISLVYLKQFKKSFEKQEILYFIIALSIPLQVAALQYSLIGRVVLYFTIFYILLIPNILYSLNNKSTKVLGIYLLLVLSPVILYKLLIDNVGGVIPYYFFWNG